MATKQRSRRGHVAVYVRVAAFTLGTISAVVIFATLAGLSFGQVAHRDALAVLGAALAMIVAATIIVRPFDPLRG